MTSSTDRADVGKTVARALLQAGCVAVQEDEPFRLPSGWASPVYMDCRRLISFPPLRRRIVSLALDVLKAQGGLQGVGALAGGEASGIALAAWLADALDLPLLYVRKKPAGRSQIEGVLNAGDRVLLVDDLMAGGQSKVNFCRALTAAGATVTDLFVVFDYATFDTKQLLAPLGVTAHALATWADVLEAAREAGAFDPRALNAVEAFLRDPGGWSEAHGGIAAAAAVA